MYTSFYKSQIGNIQIIIENNYLIGLYIENQKYYIKSQNLKINDNNKTILKTKQWLDKYFNGEKPDIKELNVKLNGTDFRKKVWKILAKIPYGKTITYSEIAKQLNTKSAQAVGGAVGHNPISIIVPCHRVLGKNKELTGYAGGIDIKKKLLDIENIEYKE